MIRLHIAWANALDRWRAFAHKSYEVAHAPLDLGDKDPDVIWWRSQTAAVRAEKAAAADGTNPHQPVVTIHRAGIFIDEHGRTVVRDRFGTTILGFDAADPTELETTP